MLKKLVLTGAAGFIGGYLRPALAAICEELVSTDIAETVPKLSPNETYISADLSDFDAIKGIVDGAEMVIHFGAIVDERDLPELWGPNFMGSYNIWEAAHQTGARRIVYASSIHAVGMYSKTEAIAPESPHRPDTFYGLAKCFTEDLGRLYWEKRGMESVHLRILSCTEKPNNARALGTWLSPKDCVQLVLRAIDTPVVEWTVAYGVSNNDRAPVDNGLARHLGYKPVDNAEDYAPEILAASPEADPHDLNVSRHGGPFAAIALGKSGVAAFGDPNKS